MLKSTVVSHFGSQQKVADALTAAGFPITQRGVSALPDLVPIKWAAPLAELMGCELNLAAYRQQDRAPSGDQQPEAA
jgi:hypothetical protein